MGRSRLRRTAAILVACIVVHVALLSILAIEATGSRSEPPDQPAIQVTLEKPPTPPPAKPPPKPRKPPPAHATATTPQPSPAPVVHQTPAIPPNAPVVDSGAASAMGDLVRALRGSVGCDNPEAASLTAAEKEACRRRLHAGLENAKPLLGLTAEKRARFDHASACQEAWRIYRASPAAPMPRLRDCPPGE